MWVRTSEPLRTIGVFYRCSVWFDPLRTTLMDKQTLGEGVLLVRESVLPVLGVVSEPLRTTPQRKQTLHDGVLLVFSLVRLLRTSSNYTANTSKQTLGEAFLQVFCNRYGSTPNTLGPANTWRVRRCSTVIRCGSTPPNLFELHTQTLSCCRYGSNPPNLFELH